MPDQPEDDRDRVVEDFLQGGPRSEEWRLWREALAKRLADLKRSRRELGERGGSEKEIHDLNEMIEETEAQINALATEEVISEFVEAEIDLSLNTQEKDDELAGFEGVDPDDLGGDEFSRDGLSGDGLSGNGRG